MASFDSLPEQGEALVSPAMRSGLNAHGHGYIAPRRHAPGKGRIESPRRRTRRDVHIHADDIREAKRKKVIEEFYETERTYVDGLELIYSHFLTPIIVSLDTNNPLLDRSALTAVFSNFIDIWNLHRSFFSSLSSISSISKDGSPPPLSPTLLSHFPYLSLYTPFITSFPTTISALSSLTSPPTSNTNPTPNLNRPINNPNTPPYNPAFAAFIATQEQDHRCGRLKLRDWLLTIVQRTPRYLLLLKDLIAHTHPDDPEHAQLTAAHALVSKITHSLNTSLDTHAQTLALLALQRSTPNLPFQLIVPGRTFLRRGPLVQVERAAQPCEREFLLFSDCLVWLANPNTVAGMGWGAAYGNGTGSNSNTTVNEEAASQGKKVPVPMIRIRSKSEAELGDAIRTRSPGASPSPSTPSSPSKRAHAHNRYSLHPPTPALSSRRHSNNSDGTGSEERWVYKGRAELVDLEIIVSPGLGGMREREGEGFDEGWERRFEVLSPEGSFVVYAATEEERDTWSVTIRQAKAQLLVSLNVTHPHSTLASSSSTTHLRRSLQALPFPPDASPSSKNGRGSAEIMRRKLGSGTGTASWRGLDGKGKGKHKTDESDVGKRRKVEHWLPAIWIPDEKTGACMRCGRPFGWRRRRHHCRLCGRCVCASCSGRTFFISDPSVKDESKPARACDACYETVFPLINGPDDDLDSSANSNHRTINTDTLGTLSGFPSWLSMPVLPIASNPVPVPQALMAIELDFIKEREHEANASRMVIEDTKGRARLRSRPRSYHNILEDFGYEDQDKENRQGRERERERERFDVVNVPLEEGEAEAEGEEEGEGEGGEDVDDVEKEERPALTSLSSSPRKENTARRVKRFSLPAIAVQTTSVTARTGFGDVDQGDMGGRRMNRRFSLVLGSGHGRGRSGGKHDEEHYGDGRVEREMGTSVAASRLSELLGRGK